MLRTYSLALSILAAAALGVADAETTPPVPPPGTAVFVPPPPPGKRVDVGGRRLHILCKGSGPSVIIEAGLSQFTASSTYGKAQDLIAPFAHVCLYDRAGYGWSDEAPAGRTQQDMVEDLHRLLRAARIARPVVLVGHSIGGLLARLYVRGYPQDVAGVVLVDSSTEALFTPEDAAGRAALAAKIDEGLKVSKPNVPLVALPANSTPDVFLAFLPKTFRTVKEENLAIDRVPAALRKEGGYGTLGNLPLVVIRRGKTAEPPNADDIAWRAQQEKLAALSSNSTLIVAEKSGHVIPYDQPEVVADAVKRVLATIARNPPHVRF